MLGIVEFDVLFIAGDAETGSWFRLIAEALGWLCALRCPLGWVIVLVAVVVAHVLLRAFMVGASPVLATGLSAAAAVVGSVAAETSVVCASFYRSLCGLHFRSVFGGVRV